MTEFLKLSDFTPPDSDVYTGGGTDGTEAIQAVLDRASGERGLFLIADGAFLTGTLKIRSHTTIFCPDERCGFYLKDHTDAPMLANAHFSVGERIDCDVRLIGGTYNFNCLRQKHDVGEIDSDDPVVRFTHSWVFGMLFYGVYGLTVRDVVLRNQRTFAFVCGNAEQVVMENVRIDLPDILYAQNQDGLHFFGPSKNIVLRNISGTAGDDFIALAPDEFDAKSSITDVLIDGVHLNDSDQGIRLLCRGKGNLDRIIVRNVTGTYKCFGFYINPWASPDYKEGERYGNYGSITIENVDLKQTEIKYPYTKPFLFRLGGIIDTVRISGVRYVNEAGEADFMQIGGDYTFFDDRDSDCKTVVNRLIVKDVTTTSRYPTGGIVVRSCRIRELTTENVGGIRTERISGTIDRLTEK